MASHITKKQAERGERLKARLMALEEEQKLAAASYPRRNFHSRLSPDGRQLVVSQAQMVLPLLLVTYEPQQPVDMKVSSVYLRLKPAREPCKQLMPMNTVSLPVDPASLGSSRARRKAREPRQGEEEDGRRGRSTRGRKSCSSRCGWARWMEKMRSSTP